MHLESWFLGGNEPRLQVDRKWWESTLGFICKEVVHLGGCSVVGDNIEAFIVHIKNEVLALWSCVRRR